MDKDLGNHLKVGFVQLELLEFALLLDIQLDRSLQDKVEDMKMVEMHRCMGSHLDS